MLQILKPLYHEQQLLFWKFVRIKPIFMGNLIFSFLNFIFSNFNPDPSMLSLKEVVRFSFLTSYCCKTFRRVLFFATLLFPSPHISKSQEFCKSVVCKDVLIQLKMSLLWTQLRHICWPLVKQLCFTDF